MPNTGVNNATLIGVYIGGTLISKATGHSLTIGNDVFEITSKDSNGWKEIKPGLRNWSISAECRFAEDSSYGFDDLFGNSSVIHQVACQDKPRDAQQDKHIDPRIHFQRENDQRNTLKQYIGETGHRDGVSYGKADQKADHKNRDE